MECENEDSCPYLGKDFACESRSDLYEDLQRDLNNYLEPTAAFDLGIKFQNLFGKTHCFRNYRSCLYYQSQEKRKGVCETEKV